MVQETASSGKVPCLAAAPRWGAEARAKTTAAASMGTRFIRTSGNRILNRPDGVAIPWSAPRCPGACRDQEAACLVTQAMKFSSPVPVSSAIVCPCPQMVAKSTLPAPACWSARARFTSTVEAVSP